MASCFVAFFSCIVGDVGERDERRGERCTRRWWRSRLALNDGSASRVLYPMEMVDRHQVMCADLFYSTRPRIR